MKRSGIFGIAIPTQSNQQILEKILKNVHQATDFYHIVSLNPENMILCRQDDNFKRVVERSQTRIIDGVGILWASRLLGIKVGEKLSGVDLMKELLKVGNDERSKVMLIGGKENIADRVVECQSKQFPHIDFKAAKAIQNIKFPKEEEEDQLFSIVAAFKPRLIFVAFGSPMQELWIDKNRHKFGKCVILGVGGGFDFLSGSVIRAPKLIQDLGGEWLFRLLLQPWRWRRQLRLIKFIWLVFKEKLDIRDKN
ncbi:hypothetical protein A3H78_01120 [Candidatus Roizmanbacteria bacterium RIFCSPLOWO2_02_FULL_36_11]|uniref:Glycosyl transferase n=1 Tax=Candidatus Roizmanbacteria bacterium RIFCSPLOWO2_02_FULL_36_11 TaxID=1802071 RepID=A0A1F7JIK4_9BACT|nr:MAG: hypothetical protein A3H78_01120 [Candidatus Roizmanbacteria bacterium RIFCSPLOWO2_02_FULL_36_11]